MLLRNLISKILILLFGTSYKIYTSSISNVMDDYKIVNSSEISSPEVLKRKIFMKKNKSDSLKKKPRLNACVNDSYTYDIIKSLLDEIYDKNFKYSTEKLCERESYKRYTISTKFFKDKKDVKDFDRKFKFSNKILSDEGKFILKISKSALSFKNKKETIVNHSRNKNYSLRERKTPTIKDMNKYLIDYFSSYIIYTIDLYDLLLYNHHNKLEQNIPEIFYIRGLLYECYYDNSNDPDTLTDIIKIFSDIKENVCDKKNVYSNIKSDNNRELTIKKIDQAKILKIQESFSSVLQILSKQNAESFQNNRVYKNKLKWNHKIYIEYKEMFRNCGKNGTLNKEQENKLWFIGAIFLRVLENKIEINNLKDFFTIDLNFKNEIFERVDYRELFKDITEKMYLHIEEIHLRNLFSGEQIKKIYKELKEIKNIYESKSNGNNKFELIIQYINVISRLKHI